MVYYADIHSHELSGLISSKLTKQFLLFVEKENSTEKIEIVAAKTQR
jgi:hypothetical protein